MARSASKEEKIEELLTRNVQEVIDRKHLAAALHGGKKLRVKHGIDPTGAKIHIGRAVVLWKLKEFQDLGHQIVLIIGDYTAQIGDPSDKLEKRPFLTDKQIKANLKNYLPQIGEILNLRKTEIHYNSEWLSKLKFMEVLKLADLFTVSQMIKRRNFSERLEKDEDISLREFMYPLMQGYDSVAVKADVELGGTDQLFNLLAGRKIQERYDQRPQDVMMTSMLLGLDNRKMSTSWGNVINITDTADEQFGKLMSMRDEMIIPYFRTTTDTSDSEVSGIEKELKRGANPKSAKIELAKAVVARYHGNAAAEKAADKFKALYTVKDTSGIDLKELKVPRGAYATELVMYSGVVTSKSEARRLILQGAVKLGGGKVTDPTAELYFKGGEVLQVGKHHFFRLKI